MALVPLASASCERRWLILGTKKRSMPRLDRGKESSCYVAFSEFVFIARTVAAGTLLKR